jgi:hypothetical protein
MGRDAKALLSNVGRSAFGAMSPFSRFASYGIKFLCLGVELRNCITYIHHLEQNYGCPHRYNKSFNIEVYEGDKKIIGDWYANMAYRGINYASDITSLQSALIERGALFKTAWNQFPNHLAEISSIDSVGYELLTQNSCAFVNRRLTFYFDDSEGSNSSHSDEGSLNIRVCEDGSIG